AGRTLKPQTLAERGVRDLIVIFDKGDKRFRPRTECRASTRRFLPKVGLALKQITVLGRGNKFLRASKIIGVVGLAFSGQCHDGGVMKIVVPDRVEIVPAFFARQNQLRFLPLVLSDQNDLAWFGGLTRGPADLAADVFVGTVFNLRLRVEAETVEVKVGHPAAAVGDEKVANWARVWSVKIDHFAPIVWFVTLGEIMIRESPDIISVRA